MPDIAWEDFAPATLDAARAADRPILLLITAPWCAHCKELMRTTFADAAVQQLVADQFVPAHVDSERRPEVNERYGAGGWPTIAYLTPGGELISHDNWLSAEQLVERLTRVADHFRNRRAELEQGIETLWNSKADADAHRTTGKLSSTIVEDVVDAIYERFDHRYGGWGESSKFPQSEALDFALVQVVKRKDPRMHEVVTLTLDRMMEANIHDAIDGGFFRFSRTPDWRSPDHEKTLDTNSARLRSYLEAYQVFGKPAYRKAAEGIVGWMLRFMLDPETGCFFGSQDADADYYALDRDGRRARQAPRLDRTIYTNWNANTASNLLKASVVLDRPDVREVALHALQFVMENLTGKHGEVYHYWDGTYHLAGMLSDQAHLIRALIDASQHTGDADLLLPAEAIAENAIRSQRAPGGGFYDIQSDASYTGSMRRRNRSILENSAMAESLVRLSYLSRRSEFYDEAIRTLEAFTGDYKEYGYYVAGYGRAVDLVFYPPLFVTIVGDRTSPEADALRRAALSRYVPSRIVQMLDPAHDPILLGRAGYVVEDRVAVHLSVGKTTKAVCHDVDELTRQMQAVEEARRPTAG